MDNKQSKGYLGFDPLLIKHTSCVIPRLEFGERPIGECRASALTTRLCRVLSFQRVILCSVGYLSRSIAVVEPLDGSQNARFSVKKGRVSGYSEGSSLRVLVCNASMRRMTKC